MVNSVGERWGDRDGIRCLEWVEQDRDRLLVVESPYTVGHVECPLPARVMTVPAMVLQRDTSYSAS